VALPGAYVPASIAVWVTGACKPPLHDKSPISIGIIVIIIIINGVGLTPLGTAAASGLLYKPQMIDEGDCGAIGGMKIGR
jgi:hypothetical protein